MRVASSPVIAARTVTGPAAASCSIIASSSICSASARADSAAASAVLGGFSRLRSPLLGFLEGSLRVGQRRLGGLVPLHGRGGRSLGCFQIGLGLGQRLCRRFGLRLSRRRLGLGGSSFRLGGRFRLGAACACAALTSSADVSSPPSPHAKATSERTASRREEVPHQGAIVRADELRGFPMTWIRLPISEEKHHNLGLGSNRRAE